MVWGIVSDLKGTFLADTQSTFAKTLKPSGCNMKMSSQVLHVRMVSLHPIAQAQNHVLPQYQAKIELDYALQLEKTPVKFTSRT